MNVKCRCLKNAYIYIHTSHTTARDMMFAIYPTSASFFMSRRFSSFRFFLFSHFSHLFKKNPPLSSTALSLLSLFIQTHLSTTHILSLSSSLPLSLLFHLISISTPNPKPNHHPSPSFRPPALPTSPGRIFFYASIQKKKNSLGAKQSLIPAEIHSGFRLFEEERQVVDFYFRGGFRG